MKKMTKYITLPLLVVTLSGSIVPVSNVLADANVVYQAPKESDYQYLKEQRSIWTKVTKVALKKAIKNKSLVVNAVKEVSGKTVANQVDKYFTTVATSISPLLEWAEIPAQSVYDAVYRGLINAGASNSVATNVALAVREVVSWMI